MLAYAYTHGVVMGCKPAAGEPAGGPIRVTHSPFSLLPYDFPASAFERAVSLSKPFNKLMDRVSRDAEWLERVLEDTGKADPFTGRLMAIMSEVRAQSAALQQRVSLGVLRSDYMVHSVPGDERNLLQVEINTIASSFGCISTKMAQMMKAVEDANFYSGRDIPDNFAMASIASGVAAAHKEWILQQQSQLPEGKSPVVLMVVQPRETNFCDQRLLHFALKEDHGIACERASLRDIFEQGRIDKKSGQLFFGPSFVASVVYFRAGYTPDDYPTEDEWTARTLIEKSLAVKCPNIGLHIAGSKKVQQELARPNAVERFLSAEESREIRKCFAGLFALDEQKEVEELQEMVAANIDGYILKPQREGGGNNFCSQKMLDILTQRDLQELKAFILMERIQSPVQQAILVRNDIQTKVSSISELGIFGVFVSNGSVDGEGDASAGGGSALLLNEYAGYLLRVKPSSSDEGGVAAGFAVLSCPRLI